MTKPNPKMMTKEEIRAARAYCRKATALYLMDLAKLIEHGAVDGFDIAWSDKVLKPTPVGSVLFDSEYLSTTKPETESVIIVPRPASAATAETLAGERSPIMVEDKSTDVEGLKPCEEPDCPNCKKD